MNSRKRPTRASEAGFTLVEVAAAMAILLIAITALARTATVAFTDVALARQRQTANQLANQVMESVRGLPYTTVGKGLSSSDLSGDLRIVPCGGVPYYPSCDGEPLVTTPGLPETPPLVPHRGQVGPPDYPQVYGWGVYVTRAADAPEAGTYRVTVEVSWEQAARGGVATSVAVQTLVFSPEGCVDTETHPFGAPCQPYFYANGGVDSGAIVTTGTVEGLSFDSLSMELLGQSADVQVEQVSRVEGFVALPGGALVDGGAETSTGEAVTSAADDDPSTPAGGYDSVSVGPQTEGTVSVSGDEAVLRASVEGGGTGQTTSAVAASAANACNLQLDQRPCGYATGTQTQMATELTIGGGAGTAVLVSVAGSTSPVTSYANQDTGTPGVDGLARQEVHRNLTEVRIGGLPDGVTGPTGWQGYWVRLIGYQGSAAAAAGSGTEAPSVVVAGGSIEYWNGSGYTATDVTEAAQDIEVAPVDHTAIAGLDAVEVHITGTLAVERSSTRETGDGAQVRTDARASLGSPLVGELTYTVVRNLTPVAQLTIEVNLGRARAAAVYEPAPEPPG